MMKIAEMPEGLRPREKARQKGIRSLDDAELIALILRQGTKKESALQIADSLMAAYGTLHCLSSANNLELQAFPGIGEVGATILETVFELGRRVQRENDFPDGPFRAEDCFRRYAGKEKSKEAVELILLTDSDRFYKEMTLFLGSLDHVAIDKTEICQEVLASKRRRFILVHNHPSGNPTPSEADIRLTWDLSTLATSLGLCLVDHVIVGENGFYSFAENGYCGDRRRKMIQAFAQK